MIVYLLRHGDALRQSDGSGRPLSLRGRGEVTMVAEALRRLEVKVSLIYHSGKRRAVETAEIVALHLDPTPGIESLPGMSPGDDPEIVRDLLEAGRRDLMLAGHLPHLPGLASLLTTGDPYRGIVQLPTAGLIAVERRESLWRILWMVNPALLRRLAGAGS